MLMPIIIKDIVDEFEFNNVLQVIDCLCNLVEQKISINRFLYKIELKIDKCDF